VLVFGCVTCSLRRLVPLKTFLDAVLAYKASANGSALSFGSHIALLQLSSSQVSTAVRDARSCGGASTRVFAAQLMSPLTVAARFVTKSAVVAAMAMFACYRGHLLASGSNVSMPVWLRVSRRRTLVHKACSHVYTCRHSCFLFPAAPLCLITRSPLCGSCKMTHGSIYSVLVYFDILDIFAIVPFPIFFLYAF
jgi:hypothetical protein